MMKNQKQQLFSKIDFNYLCFFRHQCGLIWLGEMQHVLRGCHDLKPKKQGRYLVLGQELHPDKFCIFPLQTLLFELCDLACTCTPLTIFVIFIGPVSPNIQNLHEMDYSCFAIDFSFISIEILISQGSY